ncbi:MAG: PigN domain-containing protein, partial [archaeon]|nr:PigN domain-containing protein [archaeon]
MKGWKVNPVEFDSVFNGSSSTMGWGSADIVEMFAEGVPHMDCHTYDSYSFGENAPQLDEWVFQRVEALFASSPSDPAVRDRLATPRSIFFLHLLATDTLGHTRRPHSAEYSGQLSLVDAAIHRLVTRVEKHYRDGRTAWVFTSDHGMTSKGSHGDGEPANTETPYVVWGSGISKSRSSTQQPAPQLNPLHPLKNDGRMDIEQADMAPLMAALLGIHFPMNSVGVLPIDLLDASEEIKGKQLAANAEQIHAQFSRKGLLKRSVSKLWFSPFPGFSADPSSPESPDGFRSRIASALRLRKWGLAQQTALQWIQRSLEGLQYLQTYDRALLFAVVSIGYAGWALVLLLECFRRSSSSSSDPSFDSYSDRLSSFSSNSGIKSAPFFSFLSFSASQLLLNAGAYLLLLLQGAPVLYYLYITFPL